jgi:hypothetical protein
MKMNWWKNVIWLQKLCSGKHQSSRVTGRRLNSGFRTVRLPTCIFHSVDCGHRDLLISHRQTFLWCYVKEHVWKNNPHSLDELKQIIQGSILNVKTETLRNLASNMRKMVDIWSIEHGGHFQHLQQCKCNYKRKKFLNIFKYFLIFKFLF